MAPQYVRPPVPVDSYTPAPPPGETASAPGAAGESQSFIPGGEIPGRWWELFRSEPLDGLIRRALADSPTLSAAQAALRQAREGLLAQTGASLFPHLDSSATAQKERSSGAANGQPSGNSLTFSLFNASVSVSYAPDLFGGARSGLEALRAQVDYQRFQLEGAYLTLTSNIVTTAVKEASLRAQIGASREIVTTQERQLAVVENQLSLGGASRSDLLAQRAQLSQARAALPPLEKELELTRHQLAVLAGLPPSEAGGLPRFDLDSLSLPVELPVSLPSLLVRQRPDVRASEALLQAATAQVGVATANLLPSVTLSGGYGFESTHFADLFSAGSAIWNITAGLLQPIFHGGELTAKRRAAVAACDQAAAQYRETVLLAFQGVADALRAVEADARLLGAQAEAEAAARESLDLTAKQFGLGAVNYLSLLNAQRQYQQARIGLVQAQAARLADTAALFQALGGGWWNREPLPEIVAERGAD